MITIATIVEGHGEVKALPILVRRILNDAGVYPHIPEPHRLARSKVTSSEVARAALLASYRVSDGGILVLVDSDDDCPVTLAEEIRAAAGDGIACPIAVVCAVREYESAFLAASQSLRAAGQFVDASPVSEPEEKRGAKEVVRSCLRTSYKEVLHQPRLTSVMDLDQAAQCRWFAKLRRDLLRLAGATR